jgi:DNA-binding NarL/FixJ family response regulator
MRHPRTSGGQPTPSWRTTDPWPSSGSAILSAVPLRVLIVDDHERFRTTASRMLEGDGFAVVGEASDGAGALAAVDAIAADVLLLDVGLPDMSGIDVAGIVHERRPDLAIVLVSTQDAADYRELVAGSGARGFLAKTELSGAALNELLAGS